jgi:lysophospholipase L1-like esterase
VKISGKLDDLVMGTHYIRKCRRFTLANRFVRTGQLVLLGDSLTEFWALNKKRYPKTHLKIYNRGISADTSLGCYQRLDLSALVLKPSIIVLLIGINDFWRDDFTHAQTAENQRRILETLRAELPESRIIVQSLYPVHSGRRNPPQPFNALVQKSNTLLRENCADLGCEYLDIYSLLTDADGALRKELSPDGLHVNGSGYDIIRGAVEEAIA